jgi:hypothetical protein
MAIDTLFAQITHEAPSASRKETPLLPVCCLCRLIRDEIGASLIVRAGSRSGRIERHMS